MRLQAADVRIGMDANDHALKQVLRLVPSSRQQVLVIRRHADASRQRPYLHGPFDFLGCQIDGTDFVIALLRDKKPADANRLVFLRLLKPTILPSIG